MHRTIVGLLLLIFLAAACDRPGPTSPTPSPTEARPAETDDGSFELEGTVQEASGSASSERKDVARTATPTKASPTTESPGASPSPTVDEDAVIVIERGAPGSLAVKVRSYSAGGSPCRFVENDVLVVAFTSGTDFQPTEVTDNTTFPNNLQGSIVQITGRVEEEEGHCLLIADTVRVGQEESSPSTTRSPTRGRTSPTPSPSPTRSP